MTARNLTEIPIRGNTWRRWHQPQHKWVESKPDVVFSIGNWTQGITEWTISDHSIITGTIPSQLRKRRLLVTDWNFWTDFSEDKENNTAYSDPIGELKSMVRENLKGKKIQPKTLVGRGNQRTKEGGKKSGEKPWGMEKGGRQAEEHDQAKEKRTLGRVRGRNNLRQSSRHMAGYPGNQKPLQHQENHASQPRGKNHRWRQSASLH